MTPTNFFDGDLLKSFCLNSMIIICLMGCLQNRPVNPPFQSQNRHLNYQYSSSAYQTNPYVVKNKPTPIPQTYTSSKPYNPTKLATQQAYNQIDIIRRYGTSFQKNTSQIIEVKVPTTSQKIKFTISKQPMLLFPLQTGNYHINIVKNLCFQEKMTWLRIQAEKMRISWESGCQWLNVDRMDVIQTSQSGLRNLNLRKQLKIKLSGQQVDDAGGVLREWMHLCVKDIFSSEIAGLFRLCKTDETAYRFIVQKVANQLEDEYRMELCSLLGVVIGKALFDRIPLDCFLTRTIWRQICSQPVQLYDFYSYDSEIYKNLKLILETPNAEDLSLNFTYYVGESLGKEQEVILKPNGSSIAVDDSNKKEYFELLVDYLSVKSCQRYVSKVKQAINKILPIQILSIFQPHQMEMLLNGPQNINVLDWKTSTLYEGYKAQDSQIIWFWAYVQKLNQEKLGNLLHFVTGSRRVPILGFSFLQSNRNKINRFTIQKCQIQKHNPYPKAHTCFNRLELPNYPTQGELNEKMDVILAREINSFGMS